MRRVFHLLEIEELDDLHHFFKIFILNLTLALVFKRCRIGFLAPALCDRYGYVQDREVGRGGDLEVLTTPCFAISWGRSCSSR